MGLAAGRRALCRLTLPLATGYGFGLTFAQSGLVLLPGAIAIVVGGWASGALVRRTGVRPLAVSGAVLAAAAYAGLTVDHGAVAPIVAANVALGLGIGLAVAAISRSIGAALGAQIAAAIVIHAGVIDVRFPAEVGFTRAFVLGSVAALGALMATLAIPGRVSDPALPNSPRPILDPNPASRWEDPIVGAEATGIHPDAS